MNDLDDSEAPSEFEKHVPLDSQTTGSLSKNRLHTSISSTTPTNRDVPAIGHRLNAGRSILALALDEECVYAGLQGGDILVWSLETYELLLSVHAHEESVLSLYLSEDGALLFSSGGDSVVNVWSTVTFDRLYSIYSHHDVGDIFSVVYSSGLKTVYCGGQNTSLQWCQLAEADGRPGETLTLHPADRRHRFFDSRGPDGTTTPRSDRGSSLNSHSGLTLTFKRDQHRLFSHYGYIYAMALVRGLIESAPSEEVLLTGSGDGTVKIWRLSAQANGAPVQLASLNNGNDAVLSIDIEEPLLYCGLENGSLNIWNLESSQLVKQMASHSGELWTIDVLKGFTFTGDSHGVVKKFNSSFEEVGTWQAHRGTMLASASAVFKDRRIYATGGNDDSVVIWDLPDMRQTQPQVHSLENNEMVNTLSKFVSFKTVSSHSKYAGECNQGAAFLRRHCNYLGAKAKLLPTGADTNPVVYARFAANSPHRVRKTLLFYGHYDVVGADTNRQKWRTDPFSLESVNGFLYGRGTSDNKGPILAALYAAADLLRTKALTCDVVFLIEGEEESGSQGFQAAVRENKQLIGEIDWILLANSYWLDDHIPCLTYGLRGVVHANLMVSSDRPDLHSGIDGSALLDEPLKDLSVLLSSLTGRKGQINIPGFHDNVLALTSAEASRYDAIAYALLPHHPEIPDREAFTKSLMFRWREPSLTIHSIDVPGNRNVGTTISRRAKASLSIRIVPNQDVDEVSAALIAYAQEQFDLLDSQNDLTVEITGKSDPWLGDPENEIFKTLSDAVAAAWVPDQEVKRFNYPPSERQPLSLPVREGLYRTASNDSVSSQVDRVITSTTIRSRKHTPGKAFNATTSVPTSSTLAQNANLRSVSVSMPGRSHPATDSTPHNVSNSQASTPSASSPPPSTAFSDTSLPAKPIYIREGGSIPTIRFLEKEFSAPAANLPCGQASDHAHLDNERLRVINLYKSREIFRHVFEKLPIRSAR